jgi:hypothetical protein
VTRDHEIRAQREPAQLTQALRNAQLAVSGLASARRGRRRGPRVSLSAADPAATDPPPPTSATAETFASWLATSRVSARTRATYAERAGRFLGWLDAGGAGFRGG